MNTDNQSDDGTIDPEYHFQPTTQLSTRQLVKLLGLRSDIREGAYRYDNEIILRDADPDVVAHMDLSF